MPQPREAPVASSQLKFCAQLGVLPNSLDRQKRTITFVASTEEVDSYDEVVEQEWRFERFAVNPVILWNHNSWRNRPEQMIPIGRALDWRVVVNDAGRKQLQITTEFAPAEVNEWADKVYRQYEAGFMRAVSVGFWPNEVRAEKREGKTIYVLSDNELFELSAVPIGANYEAVSLSADGDDVDVPDFSPEGRRRRREALALLAKKHETPKENPDMDPKELEKRLAEAEAAVAKAKEGEAAALKLASDQETKVKELEASMTEKDATIAKVTAERDAARKTVAEHDVEALLKANKLLPAAREKWLKLRIADEEQFKELSADLQPLGLTSEITKGTELAKSTLPATGNGALADHVENG
jgi:phage head maturation protease